MGFFDFLTKQTTANKSAQEPVAPKAAQQPVAKAPETKPAAAPAAQPEVIQANSTIKIKSSAVAYTNGSKIPNWVKSGQYSVIKVNGNKALISDIVSWVYLKDLELASTTKAPVKKEEAKQAEKVANNNTKQNTPAQKDTGTKEKAVEEKDTPNTSITKGSKVVLNTKTWSNGKAIAPSVLHTVFDVIKVNNNVAQIGKGTAVTGSVKTSGLVLNSDASKQAESLSKTHLAWGNKASTAFCKRVIEIAKELEMPPEGASWLMAVMNHESGLNPANVNSIGAVGLIQFLKSTATALGTTTAKLKAMDAVAQLEYVLKYLKKAKSDHSINYDSIYNVYMAVFSPAFTSKGMDETCYKKGSAGYNQNNGLDTNKDGKITKREVGGAALDELKIGLLSMNRKPLSDFK